MLEILLICISRHVNKELVETVVSVLDGICFSY